MESMVELTKEEKRELARKKKVEEKQKNKIQSTSKKFLLYVLIFIAVGYFGYKAYQFFATPIPEVVEEPVNIFESDWIKEEEEYTVTLIEYGDFQCPACGLYYSMVKKLLEDHHELRVVYRHFPLPSHANAFPAALAAEAAGDQGKFWEMHDILYERQSDWSDQNNPKDKFVEYAEELKLNKEQFENYYESEKAKEKVNTDMLSGIKLGVDTTPTFYLNGEKLRPVRSYDEFNNKVKEEINK